MLFEVEVKKIAFFQTTVEARDEAHARQLAGDIVIQEDDWWEEEFSVVVRAECVDK
jgi:hypothetical protein